MEDQEAADKLLCGEVRTPAALLALPVTRGLNPAR